MPPYPTSNTAAAWTAYNNALVREDRERDLLRRNSAPIRQPHRTVSEGRLRNGHYSVDVENAAGGRMPRIW
jgi:hypothetical protein